MIYVWVDDTRHAPFKMKLKGAKVATSYEEAIDIFLNLNNKHEELYIDFDYNLNSNKTGYDIAKWLVEHKIKGSFHIHSTNLVEADNIRNLLKHYGWIEKSI